MTYAAAALMAAMPLPHVLRLERSVAAVERAGAPAAVRHC